MYKRDVKQDYKKKENKSEGFNSGLISKAILVFILVFGALFYYQNSEKINEYLSEKLTKKENNTENIEQKIDSDSANETTTEKIAETIVDSVIDENKEFENRYNEINKKHSSIIEKYPEFEAEITDLIGEAIISDKTEAEIDNLLNDYVKRIEEKEKEKEKERKETREREIAEKEKRQKEAERKAKEKVAEAARIKNDDKINVRIVRFQELNTKEIDIAPEDQKIIKNAPEVLKIDLKITNGKNSSFQLSDLELMLDINGSRAKLLQKSTVKEKANQLALIAELKSGKIEALSETTAYILCAPAERWKTLVLKSPPGKGFPENWSDMKIMR